MTTTKAKPKPKTKEPDMAADASESLTEGRLFDPTSVPLKLGHVSSLAARFSLPPFTQLDGRAGWWQDRKRQWADLGLKSAEGRDAKTFAKSEGTDEVSQKILALTGGQSIFDPVLCEMAYRWFCPIGGSILDPFAGGSVRGIVAATTGRYYTGIDLSLEQVEANVEQSDEFVLRRVYERDVAPEWIHGDSRDLDGCLAGHDNPDVLREYDFVWSCPPYHDLEVYSDDPADLSNMDWDSFVEAYGYIVDMAVGFLKEDRFCGFVVGEIRGPDGFYRHFVNETIDAFERAGAAYYNEAFLVSPAGTLPLRAAKQFVVSRKLGRTHQTVLVFVKGDPKKAAAACDPEAVAAYVGDLPPQEDADVDYTGMEHG